MQNPRDLDAIPGVPAASLTQQAFIDGYLLPRQPLILQGAAAAWPAVSRWTPAFFRERYGHLALTVDSNDGKSTHEFNFGEYIDYAMDPATVAAQLPYVRNLWLAEVFPDLLGDVLECELLGPNWFQRSPLREILADCNATRWQKWLEFFFSGPGRRFPFVHQDVCMTHAWSAQIFGRKQFFAWPPAESRRGQTFPSLRRDLEQLFPDAKPVVGTIAAGDILFMPAGWHHTAESVTASITVSGNFVNGSNWSEFCEHFFRDGLGQVLGSASGSASGDANGGGI